MFTVGLISIELTDFLRKNGVISEMELCPPLELGVVAIQKGAFKSPTYFIL